MAANAFLAVLLLAVVGVSVTSAVRCYDCQARDWDYNEMQMCAWNPWNGNTTFCSGRCYSIFSPDEYGSVKHVKRGCTTMDIPEGCGTFNGESVCHRLCDSYDCNSNTPDFPMTAAAPAVASARWGPLAFLPFVTAIMMGLVSHTLLW